MAIDEKKIAYHIKGILEALGEDTEREGLLETPDRVARMYAEVFAGIHYSNDDIAEMFGKTFEYGGEPGDMVIVRDIDVFSYCEHHMALMYDMKVTVAYLPKDRVIGLSKIARVADMVARRLQIQERIGKDIAEIMQKITGSDDVAVLISGRHSCMTARGIRKDDTLTHTTTLRGRFRTDAALIAQLGTGETR